ncbi:MBL fold metallo-hydrolase [Streptomyces sp. MAR4 CNX-425]|uniref:MBL fold metallo-hydrolase n=1 Tax=Streptomyces sp. MAR4 CNX-425 TaxID=3406343 RepID=UPI003B513811
MGRTYDESAEPGTGAAVWGRRRVLRGAGAVAAGAVVASAAGPVAGTAAAAPRPDAAGVGAEGAAGGPAGGPAGVAVCRAGRFEVVALLDAHGTFPMPREEAFPGASAAAWAGARRVDPRAFGPDGAWELDFRCFAVRRPGGRVVLVDSGIGPADSPAASWAPVPGALHARLAAAGIAPDDVDTVVLSHLHEDHYGWSVTPDGAPAFPRARYVVQAAELAALAPGDAATTYAVAPLRRAGRLHVVDGGTRLVAHRGGDAVTLVPTPGHTPGHQSVVVDGGRRQIVIAGDVVVHAVQLVDPSVRYFFEEDPDLARLSRRMLLERAEECHAVLATAHLNRPFVPLR